MYKTNCLCSILFWDKFIDLYTSIYGNWFLDGNENKVDISIMGTNGKFFLINAHGVLRRMGAVTEIPGTICLSSWQS